MSELDIPIPDENADMKGPTRSSNWVIPLKLIAGAYPGNLDETEHRDTITAIIDAGSKPQHPHNVGFLENVTLSLSLSLPLFPPSFLIMHRCYHVCMSDAGDRASEL